MPPLRNLTGRSFGRLTVLARIENARNGHARWLCACICGGSARAIGADLNKGHTTSCGCAQIEAVKIAGLARKPDADIGYAGAHARVKYDRGRAAEHSCVDCGKQAKDWSLRRDAPVTLAGPTRAGIICRYSANPNDYDPRCRPCHAIYDRE